MDILKVEGLSKSFGGLHILQDIAFTAEAGAKIALIGPNGAGKTTLFNVLGGQLPATAGHIFLDGKEITHLTPNRRLHLGLARSFQINNLFFNLSLVDNLLLALYGAERSHFQMFRSLGQRNDLLASARNLLERMGLWEHRFETLSTLSYGDQRLVELAFALASKPKVMLLDEPSAGLPTAEAANFANTIRSLLGSTTLIFCAHDMDLVFNLADKIMVLYFGKILAQGPCQEIRSNPRVQEIYLGGEESSDNAGASAS
jgi:ABC-type branched-subunit amino acid transport system ATPase component